MSSEKIDQPDHQVENLGSKVVAQGKGAKHHQETIENEETLRFALQRTDDFEEPTLHWQTKYVASFIIIFNL